MTAKVEKVPDLIHELYLNCQCGNHGMVKIRHWEKVRCLCGLLWIALQPKRNKPLKLFVCRQRIP